MAHAPWSDIGRMQQTICELERQLRSKASEGRLNEALMKLERRYRELDTRITDMELQIQTLQEFQRNQDMLRPDY